MRTKLHRPPLTVLTVLSLALLMPAIALAHGKDGAHVMGTVKEVKQNTLVVETSDGKQQEVMTDPNTRYEKSGVAVTAADLKAGERVVVHGMKMNNGQVHAQLVKFGKPHANGPEKQKGDTKRAEPAPTPPAQGESHEHSGH
ncbi:MULTISPECIES: DUF5666 domain-containing protein [Myxococcaceae]|jgi:hypothetical protein|uniref:DUF5666 domain-containing protein n=1 Tax=Myxococcaceae TaxID=31 RepID=UPI001CBE8ED5|nr:MULTISPECIES: DUF5666 domain-containing protein [Myxococcaceae]MBZ4329684.1 DUF5666 domain-containing protein [Corallococcus sp. AS-1-12]MBZ4400617.1 DUF5666 domain-containing protein [Myxococcus sp. AS-1-15]